MVMTIRQEEDKQWRIVNETLIKAKSVRGYRWVSLSLSDNPICLCLTLTCRTNNRKWTENKFKCGSARPELVDDWDQRLVVTTLAVNEEGTRLSLDQLAETDQVQTEASLSLPSFLPSFLVCINFLFQLFCKDSTLLLEVEPEDRDTLIMTCMTKDTIAWRKYQRQVNLGHKPNRKISAPF